MKKKREKVNEITSLSDRLDKEVDVETFKSNLLTKIEKSDYTTEELAGILGCSDKTINNWKDDKSTFTRLQVYIKLEIVLGTSLSDLASNKDQSIPVGKKGEIKYWLNHIKEISDKISDAMED